MVCHLTERRVFAIWYKTLQEMILSCKVAKEGNWELCRQLCSGSGQGDLPTPSRGSSSSSQAKEGAGCLTGQTALGYWDSLQSPSAAIFTSCCWLYDWLEIFWQNNVSTKETVLLKLTHFKKRMTELIHLDFSHLKNEAFHFNSLPWKQFISTSNTLIYCAFKY